MLEVFAKHVPIRHSWYFRIIKRRLIFILVFLVPILVFLVLVLVLVLILVLIFVLILIHVPILIFVLIIISPIRTRTAISSNSPPAHLHHTLGSLYKNALPIGICRYGREQIFIHLRTSGDFG